MIRGYNPRKRYLGKSWKLYSLDFFDKFGFREGDVFDELNEDEQMPLPPCKDILGDMLNAYVIPKFKVPCDLYTPNSSHNPFRIEDGLESHVGDFTVIITAEQVFEFYKECFVYIDEDIEKYGEAP